MTHKDADNCETVGDMFVLVQNDKIVFAIPSRNVVIVSTVSNDEYEAYLTSRKEKELQQKVQDEKNIEENKRLTEQQEKNRQFDKFENDAMKAFANVLDAFKQKIA